MAYLFADTTYDINIGLLTDDFRWIEFYSHPGQKASSILQVEAQKLCERHGIKPRQLKGIITVAGPGFYTGLRLSEGFADIFKFFGIPSYSLYSYEIPEAKSGAWVTKAYRGEYFMHDLATGENHLVAQVALEEAFIHSPAAIDIPIPKTISTLELIKLNPSLLCKVVKTNQQRESYYFRAPEDEFRTADK